MHENTGTGVACAQPARRSLPLSVSPQPAGPANDKRSEPQLSCRMNCECIIMSGLLMCSVDFKKVIPMTCVHTTLCRAEDGSGFPIAP